MNLTINMQAKYTDRYDVIVCGGGTAGCVAALAAAREGAKTLLLEAGYFLGGMTTMGNAGLTKYVLHGIDPEEQKKVNDLLETAPEEVQVVGGIPLEITNKMIARGDALGNHGTGAAYVMPDPHAFKLFWFELLREAGVKISLHSHIIDVSKCGNRIDGVFYHTKDGLLAAEGYVIIDCTGDGDVCAFAGVPFRVGAVESDSAVKQGLVQAGSLHVMGSMYRIGGADFDALVEFLKAHPERYKAHFFGQFGMVEFLESYEKGEACSILVPAIGGGIFQFYNNPRQGILIGCTCINTKNLNALITDQLTQAEYEVLKAADAQLKLIKDQLPGFENAYVLDVPAAGPTGTRETRHIEGEYQLTFTDVLTGRQFDDCVCFSSHPIDISCKPEELQQIEVPKRAKFSLPYRSLVAKGVDNLLMAGRHISATREASGCTRVTVCCMAAGEAAGTAAAMLAGTGIPARALNTDALRQRLKQNGVKC